MRRPKEQLFPRMPLTGPDSTALKDYTEGAGPGFRPTIPVKNGPSRRKLDQTPAFSVLLTGKIANLFTKSSDQRERVSARVRKHRFGWWP